MTQRWRRLLAVAAGLAMAAGSPPAPAQDRAAGAGTRCAGEAARDRIAGVDARLEIALVSGGRVRLADIRLAGEGAGTGSPGPGSWLASLAGQEVEVTAVGGADRWGRRPARVGLVEASGTTDLAEFLVAEGWAAVDPGERDALCRPDLLGLENRARTARLGLWRAGRLPVQAAEPDVLRGLEGGFAVVEGRIVSVGERKDRTYLNFGRDFARDFAVVIPRRAWAAMRDAGLSADALRGRTVRVRGTVEVRRAPTIEIVTADAIERLETGQDRSR